MKSDMDLTLEWKDIRLEVANDYDHDKEVVFQIMDQHDRGNHTFLNKKQLKQLRDHIDNLLTTK